MARVAEKPCILDESVILFSHRLNPEGHSDATHLVGIWIRGFCVIGRGCLSLEQSCATLTDLHLAAVAPHRS